MYHRRKPLPRVERCRQAAVACLLITCSTVTTISTAASALTDAQQDQLHQLLAAEQEGLEPADYGAIALARLAGDPDDPQHAGLADRLARTFAQYLYDLAYGRLEPALDPGWHIQRPEPTAVAALDPAADRETAVPPYQQYRNLRAGLQQLLEIRDSGGWPEIPAGPDLQPGSRDARVVPLRNRLRISGHYTADMQADPWYYDVTMAAAVRRAQDEFGLWSDGIVGDDTRAALNLPVERRIDQVKVAMERWRWMPRAPDTRYALVNIAAAHLEVIEHDRPVLSMQAIVGRDYRQTPSLQGELDTVTLNPAWSVPHRIATEDLLPQQQRDATFLARNHIKVIDPGTGRVIPLTSIERKQLAPQHFRYRLRQSPGPDNSLGSIRFAFDNTHDIYLHGTPNPVLFKLLSRTFSSGCIRLADPVGLAGYMLATEHDMDRAHINAAIETGTTRHLRLARGLPLYLVYMNAWADADGNIHYGNDPYGRDRPLQAAWHRSSIMADAAQ